MRLGESLVVATAERPGPRVEQLERRGAGIELAGDGRNGVVGETAHQLVPGHLVGVHQGLGVLVGATRPTFDQVAGHGERCPGEGQDRDAQLAGEDLDGLDHVWRVDLGLEHTHPLQVVRRAERIGGHRSGAGSDIDAESDRVGGHDDVAVEHGRIDPVAAHRLHRDLRRQHRIFDRVEDAAHAAYGLVLRQAAPGLAHEPDRSVGRVSPVGRGEERVIRQDGHRLRTLPAHPVQHPVHPRSSWMVGGSGGGRRTPPARGRRRSGGLGLRALR